MSTIEEVILTDKSPKIPNPPNNTIKLWPHQEAMLYRIHQIEKSGYLCKVKSTEASLARYMDKSNVINDIDVCLGVMNDPPGSGKTYAILTHILTDIENKGVNIIIVPQNIYAQWRQSIEVIFKNHLEACKFSTSYADIMDIYGNPDSVKSYKVILLLDNFAEMYFKTLNDKDIDICRVIVDEIDIMDKFVSSAVKTKYVWLMSASYKDQKQLGPYHIGDHRRVICKCDINFVNNSLNLPIPNKTVILCDDPHIALFNDILEKQQLKSLNAGDFMVLNRLMNQSGSYNSTTIGQAAKKYAEYLFKKSEGLEEAEKHLHELTHIIDEKIQKEYNILRDKVTLLRKYRQHSQLLEERLASLPDLTTLKIKDRILENDIIAAMQDKNTKWLIFNDNGNVLIKYQSFLLSKEIKNVMLDGGNQKLIEKALKDYKEGDTQVLLLNSMIEGAGMNLENTTHLLFMHKTEEKFIEQVIGRAQRYGRKEPLNIVMLYNKSE